MFTELQNELKNGLELSIPSIANLDDAVDLGFELGHLPVEEQELENLESGLELLNGVYMSLVEMQELGLEDLDDENATAIYDIVLSSGVIGLVGLEDEAKKEKKTIKERIDHVIKTISRFIKKIGAKVRELFEKYVKGAKGGVKKTKAFIEKLEKEDFTPSSNDLELPAKKYTSAETKKAIVFSKATAEANFALDIVSTPALYKGILDYNGEVLQKIANGELKDVLLSITPQGILLAAEKAGFNKGAVSANLIIGSKTVELKTVQPFVYSKVTSIKDKEKVQLKPIGKVEMINALKDIQTIFLNVMEASPKLMLDAANKMQDVIAEQSKMIKDKGPKSISSMAFSTNQAIMIMRQLRNKIISAVISYAADYYAFVNANYKAGTVK